MTITTVRRRPLAAIAVAATALSLVPMGSSAVSAASTRVEFTVSGKLGIGDTTIQFPGDATWTADVSETGIITNGRISAPTREVPVPNPLKPDLVVNVQMRDAAPATGRIMANGRVTISASFDLRVKATSIGGLDCKISPVNVEFTTEDGGSRYDGSTVTITSTGFSVPALSAVSAGSCGFGGLASGYLGLPTSEGTAVSFALTRLTAPSTPRAVDVRAGDGAALVEWSAPRDDGGSPITEYRVQYRPASADRWRTASVELDASDRTATVDDLVNGRRYAIRVGAVNDLGVTWSAVETVRPRARR